MMITSWMMVSPRPKNSISWILSSTNEVNDGSVRVKLQGLNENFKYHVSINETTHYGDELMNVGLITTDGYMW